METEDKAVLVGGVYRHFKGFPARIITLATHTETGEQLVIYECKGTENSGKRKDGIYARPLEMFLSEVDHEKYPEIKQQYRFELIEEREENENNEN